MPATVQCPLCFGSLVVKCSSSGQVPGSYYVQCRSPLHAGGQHFFHRFAPGAPHVLPPVLPATQPNARSSYESNSEDERRVLQRFAPGAPDVLLPVLPATQPNARSSYESNSEVEHRVLQRFATGAPHVLPPVLPPMQPRARSASELDSEDENAIKVSCAHPPCASTRVHRDCQTHKCRKHCWVAPEKCRVHKHKKSQQTQKVRKHDAVKAARRHATISTVIEDPDVEEVRRKAFEVYWASEQARIMQQEHELDRSLPTQILSPSPKVPLEVALQRYTERETHNVQSAGPSSLRRLRPLSPSPDFPTTLLPLRVPTRPGDEAASPPSSSSHIVDLSSPLPPPSPRRRIAAPSARPARPPRLTQQLNATWAGIPRTSTSTVNQQESGTPLRMTSTVNNQVSGTSLLYIPKPVARRQFAPPDVSKQFILLFMTNEEPHVISVDGSQVPHYPLYQLSRDSKALAIIGDHDLSDLQLYLDSVSVWASGYDANSTHTVSKGCVLALHRRGVKGPNDNDILHHLLHQLTPHIRYNLPQERAAVRATLKAHTKGKGKAPVELSDSEIEVVSPLKQRRHATPDDERSSSKRPRRHAPMLTIDTIGLHDASSTSNTALTTGDSAPPSALSLTFPSTSSVSSASPSPSPALGLEPRMQAWPSYLFVIDFVEGLAHMASAELKHLTHRRQRFAEVFPGATYVPSSFDYQVDWWSRVPSDLREHAIAAGRTNEGLWAALKKAVKDHKKTQRAAKAAVAEAVAAVDIEDSDEQDE